MVCMSYDFDTLEKIKNNLPIYYKHWQFPSPNEKLYPGYDSDKYNLLVIGQSGAGKSTLLKVICSIFFIY